MTRSMYDAAFPPPDPHLDVCAFYIGGDTPHIWSDAEIAGQSARWRLPIYTRSDPAGRSGASDAAGVVAWFQAHNVPRGSAVALDYETAVDSGYVTAFDQALRAAGWTVLLYGSLSTVTQNARPSAGYWTASWTGIAHLDAGAAATQWVSDTMLGQPYDLSEVSDSLVLWDTRPPAPPAAPTPTFSESPMEFLVSVQADPANPTANQGIWLWDDGKYAHVASPNDVGTLAGADISGQTLKNISLSFATHQALLAASASAAVNATVTIDPTAFVAALTQAAPATAAAIAHALAVQEHADTPAS